MITKDKRQLLKSIVETIDDSNEDTLAEIQGMYDHEIDALMTNVLAAIGEEANLDEVFELGVIKDWVDDNINLLFPLGAPKPYHHCRDFEDWIKRYTKQFRIDAIFTRKEIEVFAREE
ncbi:MAG: hypothetical protein ABSE06_12295 [Anaerolineaceae bacterium]|jgi:hypothetical protein